jgi:hypothetical protein
MSEKTRTELASNADWILYREGDSVKAESRKDGTKRVLSSESIKEMRSLLALVEGSGVKVE